MKHDDPKPLEQDLREALEAERVAVFAPDEAKARVLGRVARTVGDLSGSDTGSGGERGATAPGSTATAIAAARARWLANPLLHLVSFGVGALAGIFFWRTVHEPPRPPIAYLQDPPASAPPPIPDAPQAAPATSVAPSAPTPTSSNAPPGNSLTAERTLLDVARSAFGRGEGDAALAALARHEKLFPNGQLAEEREALVVRSLVLTQRVDQARARAARFRKRYPASVMLPAVEAAVGGVVPSP
jgi:hypothetical protein